MSGSGSGFIKRNRPPRVQIQYQDPYESEKMVELPFVMGVMSDLSGENGSAKVGHGSGVIISLRAA